MPEQTPTGSAMGPYSARYLPTNKRVLLCLGGFGYRLEGNVISGCVPLVSGFSNERKQTVNLTAGYVFLWRALRGACDRRDTVGGVYY